MTKAEWLNQYAEERRKKREHNNSQITLESCVSILRELYDHTYTPKEEAIIRLVNRYKSKLGKEWLDKIESFKPAARQRAKELMKSLIYSPNPFLSMMPKEQDNWSGGGYPAPTVYQPFKD